MYKCKLEYKTTFAQQVSLDKYLSKAYALHTLINDNNIFPISNTKYSLGNVQPFRMFSRGAV